MKIQFLDTAAAEGCYTAMLPDISLRAPGRILREYLLILST